MEQPNFRNLGSIPVARLVSDALVELERLGYSRRSRNRYRAVWQHLIEYSDRNNLGDEFSGDLAVRFLEGHRGGEDMETPGRGWRKHIVWGVALLADLAEKGRIERAFTDVGTIHLDPAMEKTLGDYVLYCRDRLQLRPGTLHERKTELTIFLDFLHSKKARALDQIQPLDLSAFI